MCAVRSAENISTRLLAGYHGIGETSFRGYPTLMEQSGIWGCWLCNTCRQTQLKAENAFFEDYVRTKNLW